MRKKTAKRLKKIFISLFIVILLIFCGAGVVTYYYGNDILKEYIETSVESSSKGMYHVEIRRLYINFLTGTVNVTGVRLVPDTVLYNRMKVWDTLPPILVGVEVEKIKIRGLDFIKLVKEKAVSISRIIIESPEVKIFMESVQRKERPVKPEDKMFSIPIPKRFTSVIVNQVSLTDGKLTVIDQANEPATSHIVQRIGIEIKGFRLDSAAVLDDRILESDDITLTLHDPQVKTKNGLYLLTMSEIGMSTGASNAWIKDLHIEPLFSKKEFSKKVGYQTDRLDIKSSLVSMTGVDLRRIAITRKLDLDNLTIDGLVVEDYRDKRVPLRPNYYPPLPHQALKKAKVSLLIDTVRVTNGKIKYYEQTGDEPGLLFFDRVDGTILNLTNDSAMIAQKPDMTVNATLFLMGKGKLSGRLVFPLGGKNENFNFSGTLSSMDLKEINPMLTKLAPAEITNGKVKKLEILPVTATPSVAKGTLKFYYTDLEFKIAEHKTDGWSNFKNKVLNLAASVYVVSNNPDDRGKFTDGIIYFERDRTRGIFNYLWKMTFSGLKSSMKINTKEQKEIKKERKKKK